MGAASGLKRGTEGMPEMQKPLLEHAAPKANQNQGLDGHLADEATALMQKADEFSPSNLRPFPIPTSTNNSPFDVGEDEALINAPVPQIEMMGQEFLDTWEYSVLEIEEKKAVSVSPHFGLVYVVELKGKPGKRFVSLNFIPAKDLKMRTAHPQHLKNRTDAMTRIRRTQGLKVEGT
jgi:hypothetical protein